MALMETPCGERINVGRWVYHLPKCMTCMAWWNRAARTE